MNNIVRPLAVLYCMVVLQTFAVASRKQAENYIQSYSTIAIGEMKRTGIPASIKLAQAMLESDIGRSDLARLANNHFGIKCGGDWQGEVYYKPDDEKDTSGYIVNSCFRSFPDATFSFRAHSDFLTNPAKKARYGPLFELPPTDYKAWAYGLRKAGYATDPKYPEKLIRIIEEFRLFEYDVQVGTVIAPYDSILLTVKPDKTSILKKNEIETIHKKTDLKYGISSINDVKMVYAKGGETLGELSQKMGYDVFELLEYNEGIESAGSALLPREIIFLERKKKSYQGENMDFHIVKEGETTFQISQKYGIRHESLLAKNHLPDVVKVNAGEKLSLVHTILKKETPKFTLVERFEKFLE